MAIPRHAILWYTIDPRTVPHVSTGEMEAWRRRADSNRRITDLQSAALPLGYGATSLDKRKAGAGNGIRTRDPDLGKVVLYH